MATRGYRRIGLHRQIAGGGWENFCDIHFRYHQNFRKSTVWFGDDNVSINDINKAVNRRTDDVIYNNVLPGFRDISEGGLGQLKKAGAGTAAAWECDLVGPLLYRGRPYQVLIVCLAGSFMANGFQMGALLGAHNYDGTNRETLHHFGHLKWRVETRRRVSRRKANRLRG